MAIPTAKPQKTVLIIDDQPFFITLQQAMLQKQGYRVLAASTGAEGLAQAKQHKPDLILLDVEMPGMDGFAVCEKLKQDEELKKIPVIILTATRVVEDLQNKFRELGVFRWMDKPFDPDVLIQSVREAIQSR